MTVKVRLFEGYQTEQAGLPASTAGVWEVGQLLSYESGELVKLDAATEDATFAGISAVKKEANITYPDAVVITRCIAEAAVKSAAYNFGDALAYNAGSDYLESTSVNTIAWAWEKKTGTTLKVLFDVVKLAKLFPVNA